MQSISLFPQSAHTLSHSFKTILFVVSCGFVVASTILLVGLLRLASVLARARPAKQAPPSSASPTHLLVVLGSGGHTAEMLNLLTAVPNLHQKFTHRTYVISSGDGFSASKATEFERDVVVAPASHENYSIVTVRRARRVHQSFFTTPLTAVVSLWDCLRVLHGSHPEVSGQKRGYPDLILTNGPGTGVCIVVSSLILLFLGIPCHLKDDHLGEGQMRTVFIESWARVKTLSLSGKLLRPMVSRFFVQWPQLAESEAGVEYIGPLVS